MASGRMVLACVLGVGCALLSAHGHAGRLTAGEPLPSKEETPGAWRKASRDGANCLYLMLSLSGRKVDYADVTAAIEASGRGSNLAGLRDAARRLGLETSVYQWGPGTLARAPGPVIAYMDTYQGEDGYFSLVFQATDVNCSLVNGANVTFQDLRAEDFRQVWSGYVLAPTEPPHSRMPELLSCGMGILILAGYGWLRARPALATLPAGGQSRVA
jgi:hypothetical protein